MQTHFTLKRIVAVALLVYALALFTTAARDVSAAEEKIAELQAGLTAAEAENKLLKAKLAGVQSDAGIEAVARERLGLVMPGEKIFYFTTDGENTGAGPAPGGGA